MAVFVDFVGLNTLVEEPVDVNTNTVGNFIESKASGSTLLNAGRGSAYPEYSAPGSKAPFAGYGPNADGTFPEELRNRTTALPTKDGPGYIINGADYLTALNLHRNGPYGYPIFKQLRAGQSPIIRRQRLTNIFSHYEFPGQTLTFETGRNTRNFTLIRLFHNPAFNFNADLTTGPNSTLVITIGGTSYTVEFDAVSMSTVFDGSNKMKIGIFHSDIISLRSDHDRVKLILDKIASAIRALNLPTIGRVITSSSNSLYRQAYLYIEAKAFGSDGVEVTSTYNHVESFSFLVLSYTGAPHSGDSVTLHESKVDKTINFVSGNDQGGIAIPTDTKFTQNSNGAFTANINIDTVDTKEKTATAVKTLINSLATLTAEAYGGTADHLMVKTTFADKNNVIKHSEVDSNNRQGFSSYVHPGAAAQDAGSYCRVVNNTATEETISRVVPQRRGPVEHFNEVPVVSRHKPLRMIGSVTTLDPDTNKDVLERVEVYTTLGNETTHFSNGKLNKFYGTEGYISEDYENFVDLYLEGGVDGDESPIDEFRYLSYKQVVYPKEIYTYKNHTRNRINFISRYWRDARKDRTETDADNGFGFNVFSQSAWVLDAEQDFKDLTFLITPGVLTMRHPNFLLNKVSHVSSSFTTLTASTETFTFPDSRVYTGTPKAERAISLVNLGDSRLSNALGTARHYSPIAGLGGYPNTNVPVYTGGDPNEVQAVAINPWDVGIEALHRYTVAEEENTVEFTSGLRKAFEKRGYKLGDTTETPATQPQLTPRLCKSVRRDPDTTHGMQVMLASNTTTDDAAARAEWRLKTTSSTISTWLLPNPNNIPQGNDASLDVAAMKSMFLSGTLYHETVTVTPLDGSPSETKLSKIVSFDPNVGVVVKLGTVFSASANQAVTNGHGRLVYIGANEPGAVMYKTTDPYGVDNPIYKSALSWNKSLAPAVYDNTDKDIRKAKFIAATSVNHFLAELNLSGSEPQLGLASTWSNAQTASYLANRGELFQQKHAHNNTNTGGGSPTPLNVKRDPNGYARIYINASSSAMTSPTTLPHDPYKFLSGSQSRLDGSFQEQLVNSNSSLKLKDISTLDAGNRGNYNLSNTNFVSLSPFNSKGFSFSYWIKFGEDPEGYGLADNLIFSIQDKDGNTIIDHSIGGSAGELHVNFKNGDGNLYNWRAVREEDDGNPGTTDPSYYPNDWYNVTFTLRKDGANMVGDVKVFRKNEKADAETSNWTSKAFTTNDGAAGNMTYEAFAKIKDSKKLYVLPAGASFIALRDNAASSTALDNVNLDGLMFWNGGLTNHQMTTVLSGSDAAHADMGFAGSAPPVPSGTPGSLTTLYPATDTSIALQSVDSPTFRHGRRLHEMNTHRGRYHGATNPLRGLNMRRGDRYHPLGDNFTALDFQNNVLGNTTDGANDGDMSYSFWFKPTHQNYRNRSLRYQAAQLDASHPMTFNSNISNRSKHYQGFMVSFWMRRNGLYSNDYHTNIISEKNNRWGICVTPDSEWYSAHGSTPAGEYRRNLALWFESDPRFTPLNFHPSSGKYQTMFMSTEQMPEDDEWHHCIVQWNGKVGLECSVFFSIDGSRYAHRPGPNRNSIPEPTYGIEQNGDLPLMNLKENSAATESEIPSYSSLTYVTPGSAYAVDADYQHGVNIINPAPTAATKTSDGDRFKVYGKALVSHNMNIRDVAVIQDAPDFATSKTIHDQLYNLGQRAKITQRIGGGANTSFQSHLELTERNYGGGYVHPYNNSHAKLIDANGENIYLSVNQGGHGFSTSYNYGKSRLFRAWTGTTGSPRRPYFQIVNENTWPALVQSKAGGWTVTFNFRMTSADGNTFRDHNDFIVLIDGQDSDNDMVFRLLKLNNNSDDLRAYIKYSDNTLGTIDFVNAQAALLDGHTHTVIFTTHGSANSAGRLYNTKLFIDGEEWSHARGNVTTYTGGSAPTGVKTIASTNNVKTLTLFARRGGDYTIPEDFFFSSIQMYRQYFGGDDSFSTDVRSILQKCTISGDSSTGASRPAIRCRDLSGALVETTITGHDGQTVSSGVVAASPKTIQLDAGYANLSNIKFLPAVVDCPLAGGWGGSLGLTNDTAEVPVRNFANRNPTLTHHYEFAREKELGNIALFDRIKKPVLPNFAKHGNGTTENCGTLLTGSNKMIVDSGPRHWNVDWYGEDGARTDSGVASPAGLTEQYNQRLFFIGDERNDFSPRTVHKGIELYLSASGGGYSLVSAIGRGTDEVKRSAENLIIPDRWYHVYGKYTGCKSGGTPSATIYLNGEEVSFTNIGGTPAGNFDVMTSNNTSHHVLTVGGAKGGSGRHNFSGFIQDFALWNNSDGLAKARICENTWDGIREGSSYINTAAGNNLVVATKMGFYEGGNTDVINKVAGYQAIDGTMYGGFDSDDRAITTGPPIEWWRSAAGGGGRLTSGATVVSFWSSLANRNYQGIIGFNSDAQFNNESYDTYGDLAFPGAKAELVNYTDTSDGAATDNSKFRRLRILIKKLSDGDGGHYRLLAQVGGVYSNNTSVNLTRERSDWINLAAGYEIDSSLESTPALNTFFHNTVILEKNIIRWYINGVECGTVSIDLSATDQSSILDHLYPRGSESTQRHFINGWNNITVLDETQQFRANSKIDEVAVLFYPTLADSSTADKRALAEELYNGGSIYSFSGRDANLYAWWRMGENVKTNTPLTLDTNLARDQRIDDESSRGQFARSHLFTLQGGSIRAIERTGAGGSDLKNYYNFTATEVDNTTIPYGKFSGGAFDDAAAGDGIVGGGLKCTINGTNQQLTVNGNAANWEYDYSFDSYKLYPFGWLATEGVPADVYIQGKNTNEGGTTDGTTRLRFGIESFASTRDSRPAISDFAIFTGTSHIYSAQGDGGGGAGTGTYDTTSQTKAVTKIKWGTEMPSAGDVLVLIANPRGITGGGHDAGGSRRELRIKFFSATYDSLNAATHTDTAWTNPAWTSRPDVRIAEINIQDSTTAGGSETVAKIIDRIQALVQLAHASHGLGTVYWSYSQPATDTLVITSMNPGGDGKWEIVGKYEGQGQDSLRCEITTVVGASHISSALTRKPGHGWVQMNDSAFSRGTYANTFVYDASLNKSGSRGLLPTMDGSTPVIKPYWYALETHNGVATVGNYETNIGLSTGKFNIKNAVNHVGKFGNYTAYGNIDSGSTVVMTLDNTPSLDFNDIRIHTGSFFTSNISSSTIDLATPRAPTELVGGSTGARAKFGPGLLQNSYNQFAQQIVQSPTQFIDPQLSASACYFRRHSLTASTSFVSPSSGFLEKLSASHNAESPSTFLIGNMSASHLFLGSAKWEAGDFAGTFDDTGTFKFKPKKPFFDNYGAFIEEARPLMKDYGIVPEFKISEHINSYLTKGTTEQKLDFLNITGGLESADTSNKQNFYEIYSTSDFLKHFELVQEDHSDFVDPFAIRLRCSVVKKFLPYEGFYPAQRTVQVAQQFYRSYGDNITVTASLSDPDWDGDPTTFAPDTKRYDLSANNNYGVQYLLNPLFSPGIMFNTIKSGVAVDYPLITDTGSVRRADYLDSDGNLIKGGSMISEQFDTRIPFEALLEPEKHLANITLASNEPDENGKTDIEVEWGGQGDQLYNLMVSNFLAETSEFFLENKSFTSLASLSQGDPNFGNAQKGNIYMMRLKMFRSTTGKKSVQKNRLSKSYGVPQDQGAVRESFTMYSRPSAFGPPQFLSGSGFTANTWSDFKFDGTSGSIYIATAGNPFGELKPVVSQHDFSYVTGSTYGYETTTGVGAVGGHEAIGNRAASGYNYPFTPPYYHGEAWADITFIPAESKKYTLQEIINQSSVEFYRYFAGAGTLKADGFTPLTHQEDQAAERTGDRLHALRGDGTATHPNREGTLSNVHDRTVVINDQAMQIASSVNIFSQGVLEQDISTQTAAGIKSSTQVQVDTDISNKYRWIIQTKFETPMLNFNKYTYGKHTNATGRARISAKRAPSSPTDDPNIVETTAFDAQPDPTADGYDGLALYTDNTYGIELPGVGPMQTPIGMWHQYGQLPQNTKEGVFLQVDDVPKSWITNAMHREPVVAKRHKSLATLCGFSTDPVRMGEVAGVKEISEAVVAIPFFEKAGRRRFFTMNRRQIRLALDPTRKNLVGRTIVDMVEKMKKFVIPPQLDFVANDKIRPFSMYIFEFNHNLTKQDLSDIWQNLPPKLHQTVETDEVSISHQLLAYELLGRGGNYRRGRNQEVELIRNDRADSVNPEIQWMVFKVKQKAKTNYFEKIFARNESQQILSQRLKLGVSADALGRKRKISYNWPYDFFSMIEGVKINAEVHFLDFDEEASQAQEKPVVKPKVKTPAKSREKRTAASRRLLGAVSGKVPPDKLKKTAEEADKKPKTKKGKITRKRREKTTIKKPDTRKKKLNNAFDRKKIK